MKAIDRILEILPLPLLAGVAALVLAAWLVKEISGHASYGPVLRDSYFQSSFVVICALLAVYYATTFIFSRDKPFADNDRGILIGKFKGDSTSVAQIHTLETLKTRLASETGLDNVKVRALDKEVTEDTGQPLAKDENAVGIIAGSYIAPSVMHYQLYWRGEHKVARLTADKYPDINDVVSQFVQQIRSTSTAANLPASRLDSLQAQIARLTEENKTLLDRLSNPQRPNEDARQLFAKSRIHVLSIGISRYPEAVLQLRFASQDATKVADVLKRTVRNAREVSVELLIDADANRSKVLERLKRILAAAKEDDFLYFYFSGHQVTRSGENYLVPYDASTNNIVGTGLSLSELIRAITNSRLKQSLLFLDATLTSPLVDADGREPSPTLPSVAGELGIMSAGRSGQLTWEDSTLGSSIFTDYLLRGLAGAAADQSGTITFDALSRYVQKSVIAATRGSASPVTMISASTPLLVAILDGRRP